MGGLDLEASGAAERINSHQLFVFVPVILCQDPRCGGQGSNGMGVVVVTGCFKHVIKALSWLSWRPPYPVLGLGRAAAWLWGSTGTSVSPRSMGSQAAGPKVMLRFMTGSWEVLKMLSRS